MQSTHTVVDVVGWRENQEDQELEWKGNRYKVILLVERPNLMVRFCKPLSYNGISEREVVLIHSVNTDQGYVNTLLLDRNEVLDYMMGLTLIANELYRDEEIIDTSVKDD